MIRGKPTILCRPKGEPGEAKAPDLRAVNDFFGDCLAKVITPCRSATSPPAFVVGLKAQAHRLRLGGLTLRPSAECE